jgi:hypothetical protein
MSVCVGPAVDALLSLMDPSIPSKSWGIESPFAVWMGLISGLWHSEQLAVTLVVAFKTREVPARVNPPML